MHANDGGMSMKLVDLLEGDILNFPHKKTENETLTPAEVKNLKQQVAKLVGGDD